jgi:LysM repeat protein
MRRALIVAAVCLSGLFAIGGGVAVYLQMAGESAQSYEVIRGDTLFEIAQVHGVTVEDLRTWNDLQGDLIEVGQVLLIWPAGDDSEILAATPTPKGKRHAPVAGAISGTAETEDVVKLTMPKALTCLEGPSLDDLDTDQAMAASEGLSYGAIRDAMNGFVSNTLPCLSEVSQTPSQTLLLEISVGCDGRVSDVRVLDHGDWSSEVASCVTDVISYTPFPAHDLPDGEVFQFPLKFTPG